MLAAEGCRQVIVTGRSLARVQETAAELAAETKTQVFTPLELDLNAPTSVQAALAELVKRGRPIDFLLLNAGMVPGKERVLTAAGVEAAQAPLIGHHQLTVGLLRANLLSPNARIVIAGAEPARGDVPMFSYTDVAAFAAKHHQGDRTAAVEALLRNGPNVKYVPNRAYADAKLIIAWWVAALARRLPSGMAVYAVSPGSAPDTQASRNAGRALKWLFIPIVKLIPGMNQTPETAARRYLQASELGTDVSGQFFASAPRSSLAQWRRCATRTFTIAKTRKPRGRPSSRSPASTSPPQHPERGVLSPAPAPRCFPPRVRRWRHGARGKGRAGGAGSAERHGADPRARDAHADLGGAQHLATEAIPRGRLVYHAAHELRIEHGETCSCFNISSIALARSAPGDPSNEVSFPGRGRDGTGRAVLRGLVFSVAS